MDHWINRTLLFLITGLSTACAISPPPFDTDAPDPASVRLAQVAESIQQHSNDLADIEAARYHDLNGSDPPTVDTRLLPGLERMVSLGAAWHGPLDTLVDKISVLAGFNAPRYLGVKPAGDVIVNVDTDYRRLVDMLHDAGTQAGSRALVTVKVKERVIEVEYLPY